MPDHAQQPPGRARGDKRSSQLIFKRRLLLVRLLLRQPRTKRDLIETIAATLGSDGYPPAAESALKNDLDALKLDFGCEIRFSRSQRTYGIETLGSLALLDVTDESLEALRFLETNFPEGEALPELANIRILVAELRQLLPAERQQQLQPDSMISLERVPSAADRIPSGLILKLRRAIGRREIGFDYQTNTTGAQPVWHRVAPYKLLVGSSGHTYLDATLMELAPADHSRMLPQQVQLRVDRIIPPTLRILPQPLPPGRLGIRTWALAYWLSPDVAQRRDVNVPFDQAVIVYHDDGSAEVRAVTHNLWQAWQTLMRYGAGCMVREPPELVARFRQTIADMAALYDINPAEPVP